ncbi:MAG: T9SS type A sorting domain-containing protein [Chitinophagales bacterium]
MRVFLYLLFTCYYAILQAQPNYNGGSYDGFAAGNRAATSFNLFAGGSNDGFSYSWQNPTTFNIYAGGNNDGESHAGISKSSKFNIYAGGTNDGVSNARLNNTTVFTIYAGGLNDGVAYAAIKTTAAFNIYAGGINDGVSQAALSNASAFNIYKGGSNDGFYCAAVAPLRSLNFYNGGKNDGFSASIIRPAVAFNPYAGGTNDGFAYLNMPTCSPASNIKAYFTAITTNTVTFNWITANQGAQFLVNVYAAGITAPVHTFTGATVADTNTVTFTGLSPAYSYCVTVEEQCDAYRSAGVSSQFCFTTASTSVCGMPGNQGIWFTSGQYLMVKWQSLLYGNSSKAYEIAGGLNITSPNQATTREINGYYISQNPAFPSYPFFTGNTPGFTWYVRDICGAGDTSAWLGPYIVGTSKTDGTEKGTSLEEVPEQTEALDFTIYPNPNTDGVLYLDAPEMDEHSLLLIYNAQGQLVRQEQLNNHSIDVSRLSNGVYLLQLTSGEQNTKLKKLVIQH